MSRIISIVYRPTDSHPEDHFTRVPLQTATLVAGYGIEGDFKGGRDDRHLNIMAAETLAVLKTRGFMTGPGEMGEQIITEGIAVDALQPGDKLYVGTACIEVVKPRTGCTRFQRIQGQPPASIAGQMGVIARVLAGGVIHAGDSVRVASHSSQPVTG